ncbi:MAG: nucleotide-binding universal stress UspA family protein [Myxococcota bacterium]|jgi:nucleotide-binding universal stress UspA family protein
MPWLSGRVLVAHDLSAAAGRALGVAAQIVGDPSRLDVVFVLARVDSDHPLMVWPAVDDSARRGHALAALRAELHDRGLEAARVHVEVGDPRHRIAVAAARLGSALVVVAPHGHTGPGRLALGSVAQAVVRTAPCQVLVTR